MKTFEKIFIKKSNYSRKKFYYYLFEFIYRSKVQSNVFKDFILNLNKYKQINEEDDSGLEIYEII